MFLELTLVGLRNMRLKIIILSQYLFFVLSQYYVSKCPVWIGPHKGIFVISLRFRSIRNLNVPKCRRRIIFCQGTSNTILFDSLRVVLYFETKEKKQADNMKIWALQAKLKVHFCHNFLEVCKTIFVESCTWYLNVDC
jgi:hypothetical protein